MTNATEATKLLFDNAGGVILFHPSYAHAYEDGKDLAADVICLLAGGDVNQWDGDEELLEALSGDTDLTGYESEYTLRHVAQILAKGYSVQVLRKSGYTPPEVTVEGRHISGHTESTFWQHVSAR